MNDLSKEDLAKKEILDVARNVFQKWGLNKTTMDDIAREAGKGRSTLYYYYKNKYEIFEAIVIQEYQTVSDQCKKQLTKVTSSREKLKIFLTVLLNEVKPKRNIYQAIIEDIRGKQELIDGIFSKAEKENIRILMEILREGLRNGEFKHFAEDELEKAALVFSQLMRSLIQMSIFDQDDEKLDILIRWISYGL